MIYTYCTFACCPWVVADDSRHCLSLCAHAVQILCSDQTFSNLSGQLTEALVGMEFSEMTSNKEQLHAILEQ